MYSLASLIPLLVEYKYFILFPLLIAEGPIVTLMAAFLSSPGGGEVMSVSAVFLIVVIADITGDTIYYLIGRLGKNPIKWIGKKLGLTDEKLISLDDFFKKHGTKAIVLGKISHGLGWPAMVGAGNSKMPYPYFLGINTIVSIGKSIVLVVLGYYYGESYIELSHYISRTGFIITTLILILLLFYFFKLRTKRKAF